jgi:CrcB protein
MSEQLLLMLLAAAAGGVGAALRFVVDGAVTRRLAQRARGQAYPYGILVVNLSGSLLIGFLLGAAGPIHPLVTVFGVGALGGYTTFSTASFDTVRLLRRGRPLAAFANGLGQLVLAVAAAAAGFALGALL